jgi:hypothetical protein
MSGMQTAAATSCHAAATPMLVHVAECESSASAHKHMHLPMLVDGPVCHLSCQAKLTPCLHLQGLLLQ